MRQGSSPEPILLYDGFCALCNWTVRFILRFDRKKTMQFAALGSSVGQVLLAPHPEIERVDSIVLVEGNRASIRSTAALRLIRYLGWPWKVLLVGFLVPREIRDSLYDVIAYWRYRWFGRYAECPLPPREARERFLDATPTGS